MDSLFLQIFLLINVFLIGALASIAIRHAYAHFKPHTHDAEKPHHTTPQPQLPREVKERLLKASEDKLQAVLDHSADQLERNLQETTGRLDRQLERLGSKIISDEMARYNKALDDLQAHTQLSISGAQTEITKHQEDLKAKLAERQTELETQLEEEMAAKKEQLLQELDTKLADAVTSFLIETLGHEVDLGAQSAYLTKMLEDHKDEIVKGIKSEA
jgi:Skp family chaperone for outer membrane proteins